MASVSFITLGCAKNEVDTNRMRALIEAHPSLTCVDEPQEADLVILNTCSFLTTAVQEGIDEALNLVLSDELRARGTKVVMSGCIPSRYGAETLNENMGEVAAFVPVADEENIVSVALDVLGISQTSQAPLADPRVVDAACAYVKISDGCDRFCSFCAIPYIRGRYASRSLDDILDEVRFLAEGGVREVVLIGQDTSVWGCDLPGEPNLASLLSAVADVMGNYDGIVRVLYVQPEGIDDELIDVIASTPAIAKYVELPLQHSSARVLRSMNRDGDGATFLTTLARLRTRIPDVCLRTTVMVGFPGETDEDFEELCAFVEEAEFDYHAVFAFSPEEGTAACTMEGQVDEEVKLERLQRMVDLTESIGFASAAKRVGNTYRVLIDGAEEAQEGIDIVGRAYFQAPESDGVVHIDAGTTELEVGSFYDVYIYDSACYELFGRLVEEV